MAASSASSRDGRLSDLGSQVEELTTQIPALRDQLRLLRMAIDEFHTDFMWAVQHVAANMPTALPMHKNCVSQDRLSGDFAQVGNENAGPDETSPEQELSNPSSDQAEAAQYSASPDAEPAGSRPVPAEADAQRPAEPRRPGPSSQPLYIRIMQRHMTEVFRAIGYDELSYVDLNRRLEPLGRDYPRQKIEEAVRELTESVPRKIGIFRLSAAARPYALQLLGHPGTVSPSSATKTEPLPASSEASDENRNEVAITLPRERVIKKFKAWLKDANRSFTPLTTETIQGLKGSKVLLPDGIVDGTELVAVRQMLSPRQREDMKSCLTLMGREYEAVRVWPTSRGQGNWNWKWEVVATSED